MFDSRFKRVLFAGVWFAVAAAIPVLYVFIRFEEVSKLFGDSLNMTITFPILLSGICGSLLGSTILDAEEIKNGLRALLRGLMVAVLSYLLMFTIPAIVLAFYMLPDLIGLLLYCIYIFVYGLLFVGWLVAAVGAVAGLLLYRLRVKFTEERTN